MLPNLKDTINYLTKNCLILDYTFFEFEKYFNWSFVKKLFLRIDKKEETNQYLNQLKQIMKEKTMKSNFSFMAINYTFIF